MCFVHNSLCWQCVKWVRLCLQVKNLLGFTLHPSYNLHVYNWVWFKMLCAHRGIKVLINGTEW
jgi:hypothetical protein